MAQPVELRQVRRAAAILKRKGLIPSSVDARKVKPDTKISGLKLSTIIRKRDDVLSGKVSPVKVSQVQKRQLQKAFGYEATRDRILIPHGATERAVIERGEVVIKTKSGIERVQIPVEYHNLDQYLVGIQRNGKKLDSMKKRGEYFGFKFFGNNSTEVYANIGQAIQKLRSYQSVQEARTKFKQQEIFHNLEIVRITNLDKWEFGGERKKSAEYNRKSQKKFRKNLKRKSKAVQAEYKAKAAERAKDYRDRIKKDPAKYKKYLKKNRKRWLSQKGKK